jgi:signal transduction histidine kinase/CheY-like chemotaxis protein
VFAVGLLGTLLLGTLLVRPLQQITTVARRIAAGDVGAAVDLPLERSDEVGAVARALSHMLERLYDQRATIESLAANLEQRVAKRTAQLEVANRELAQRLAELKQTQEQLIIADRRISVGRLAAGAAHEINNPLAFIMANLTFATESLQRVGPLARAPDASALERHLAQVQSALGDSLQGADRVHQIVRGLKTFARADDDRRTPVSIEDAVAAAIDMSAHQIKHRARLVREFATAPLVDANDVRLSQVFLNLLLNAVQSIPEGAAGGSVRVTIGTDERGWATAEVRDNGTGIAAEHLRHIFDPFFTTKPVGSGTGLGLSISQGIVTALGGEITVESEVGVGTTFRVALPPSAASRPAPAPPPPPRPAPAGAPRRKILVVDDEPLVGISIQRALDRRHDVTVTSSGREALDLILAGARFDHILCDVLMPEMTGMDFHARLMEITPAQAAQITFMTAGAFTESASVFVARRQPACLEKPLDFEQLSRIVDGEA